MTLVGQDVARAGDPWPPRVGAHRIRASKMSSVQATATKIFPALVDWWGIFRRADISEQDAVKIAAAAERNGTRVGTEAVTLGYVSHPRLSAAMAAEFGLQMQPDVEPEALILTDEQAASLLCSNRPTILVRAMEGAETRFLLATGQPERLRRHLEDCPEIGSRLRPVPLNALRTALVARISQALVTNATFGLFSSNPAYSARTVVNAWQGCVFGALGIGLPVAAWTWPAATFAVLHLVFTFFFLSCVALRFAAVAGGKPQDPISGPKPNPADLPVYSVLVALYKEAEMARQLVSALQRLDWPASKLDIKFVCEADDEATLAALRSVHLPPHMEIVVAPDFGPRTKPKALNFALQTCRGEFVVLYDAEDRPHPGQLLEAWHRFQTSGPRVGCLQAPLEIVNGDNSWIARVFAFEYTALFRGLLPWLSRHRLLLPLGGTSNHFRRSALEEVGCWDPFNVTEDADLGARLARHGYRTETLSLATSETAPERLEIWVPQRTRWFKGWLQTWLVHMRGPAALYRELGVRSFIIVQVLFGGMVISAAVHPVFMATIAWLCVHLALDREISTFQSALLVVDTINIVCGFVSFWLLGWQSTPPDRRRGAWRIVCATPLYWLLMSFAAWRALVQLYRSPHLWEKTPHHVAAAPEIGTGDGRIRPLPAE